MVIHVLELGCSLRKIELIMAAMNGAKLIIIKVLATFVFSREAMKVMLPRATSTAFNMPAKPTAKQI